MGATSSGFEMDEQDGPDEFDARSLAVRRAGTGADAWRAALDAQQAAAVLDHADFYGLTRELVITFGSLYKVMQLISRQAAGYADSVAPGTAVYDDTRQDDPRELLAEGAEMLGDTAVKVAAVTLELNRFWSLIGRIGVEDVPTRDEAGGPAT